MLMVLFKIVEKVGKLLMKKLLINSNIEGSNTIIKLVCLGFY